MSNHPLFPGVIPVEFVPYEEPDSVIGSALLPEVPQAGDRVRIPETEVDHDWIVIGRVWHIDPHREPSAEVVVRPAEGKKIWP